MVEKGPTVSALNLDTPRYSKVELYVLKDDVDFLRDVAAALSDPAREDETRALLRDKIPPARPGRLKELLASMSLEEDDPAQKPAPKRDIDL